MRCSTFREQTDVWMYDRLSINSFGSAVAAGRFRCSALEKAIGIDQSLIWLALLIQPPDSRRRTSLNGSCPQFLSLETTYL